MEPMKRSATLFLAMIIVGLLPAATGGPDQYGYLWKDSAEPDGPVYEWIDITSIGTLMTGLADDNVVAAHTLRLSSALLSAGRAHTVLPLSGVTHMTPQEEVAENLKLLQVEFLSTHLR